MTKRSIIKPVQPELIWPPRKPGQGLVLCEVPPILDAIYRPPGAYTAYNRGMEDAHRFLARAGAEKPTLDTIFNNRQFQIGDLTATVKWTATGTTQWEFILGRPRKGGGQGKGSKGSPDGDGQIPFEIDLDPSKLEELIFRGLELPHLDGKKAAAETELVGMRLRGLGRHGTHSDLDRAETLKNYILRVAAFLAQHPEMMPAQDSDLLIPVEEIPLDKARDFRYWQWDEERKPVSRAAVYLLTDISGSMTQHMRELAYKMAYLVIRFLRGRYEQLRIIILGHTHQEPIKYETWDEMVKDPQTGGTVISPSLIWIRNDAWKNNPPNAWNCYVCEASDGDNTASDNDLMKKALQALLDDDFNFYFYWETQRDEQHFPPGFIRRDSDVWQVLSSLDAKYKEKVYFGRISNDRTLVEQFRLAFTKRTEKQKK